MTIEETLSIILTPVFGDEIYPVVHPDPDGLESSVSDVYAVYTKIGGRRFNSLSGNSDLSRPRVQISIYSISYDELKTKEKDVEDAMKAANTLSNQAIANAQDPFEIEGALPNVSATVPTDGEEEETKRYFTHLEFYCWNRG